MRIVLQIGPDRATGDRLARVLAEAQEALRAAGALLPRDHGPRGAARLAMAASDPQRIDRLRVQQGFGAPEAQTALRQQIARQLQQEVAQHRPDLLILSAPQLGSGLCSRAELQSLRDLLRPLSDDIHVLAHLDDPARLLARHYAAQLVAGRSTSLTQDLALCEVPDWWQAALAGRPAADPLSGRFPEVEGAPFWLDFARLEAEWQAVFGADPVRFCSTDPHRLYGPDALAEIGAAFGLSLTGRSRPEPLPEAPAEAWLTRCRLMNDALQRHQARHGQSLPPPLWRSLLTEIRVAGPALAPGALHAVSARFAPDIAALCARHAGFDAARMAADPALPDWQEADPLYGFRATQYLMAFAPRLGQAGPPPAVRSALPPEAQQALERLAGTPFAPHNRLGTCDETAEAPAYPAAPRPPRPDGRAARVIVGCMKNEAPYIVEWVAYHRAIGFDSFLIYSNDCEDGTAQILDRLQAMGVLQHRDNSAWQGKSPQQHALDQARDEPLLRQAGWIAHIDVDEFINLRCGNGTLDDLFARLPAETTHVAMTWRLFGHGGVTDLSGDPVIAQFTDCAPAYCPKPHIAWGFKTLSRTTGAYAKLSCHRPTKLDPDQAAQVRWVNGSGADMTGEVLHRGWRNSRRSIGYDLVQLNHYALRSADSFLIKRQRGRALHVDRDIGLNYWIRMDWSGARDVTIRRNLPRLRAEMARLLADPELARWHRHGLDWHRARAAELRGLPDFARLRAQALALRLTPTERAAYALSLDMES
ncbi:MAG TPA: glycosyltransferase family 2 protein [Citreicella sp.]|nr:glycosyltransferase family 2 protein [Citreicella sp.]